MAVVNPGLTDAETSDDSDTCRIGRGQWLAIGLILVSHLPLLVVHFQTLWRCKPHYQCLPLLLLGIGWLVWHRWPHAGLARLRLRLANPLVLLGLATLTVAVLVVSPWLAALAFVLSVGGVMLGMGTVWARRDWLTVWALMWLMVPPPLDWDGDLIRALQSLASRGCGPVLDVLGVRHLVEGNVLVLPGHRLMVAEACSGVNSLLTLLIITALFVVALRRPLVRSVLLLVSSVCWAGVMNMLRLVTVTLAQSCFMFDISSGWRHETLGLVTVGLVLGLIASTDRLLEFFLSPITFHDPSAQLAPLSRVWNRCLGGKRTISPPLREDRDRPTDDATAFADAVLRKVEHVPASEPAAAGRGIKGGGGWGNWIVLAGFAALAGVQLWGTTLAVLSAKANRSGVILLAHANLFRSDDLPQTIGQWTQSQYSASDYDPTRDVGAYEQLWMYEWGKRCRATVSADYPFAGWHDLSICYVSNGWRVVERTERSPEGEAVSLPNPYLEVGMVRPDGEQGLLLFSLVSSTGRPIAVPERLTWQRIAARFAGNPLARWLPGAAGLTGTGETLQIQVFVCSPEPLVAAEREAVGTLFVTARKKLMSGYVKKQASGRP